MAPYENSTRPMPIYEYQCRKCGNVVESTDPINPPEHCNQPMQRKYTFGVAWTTGPGRSGRSFERKKNWKKAE